MLFISYVLVLVDMMLYLCYAKKLIKINNYVNLIIKILLINQNKKMLNH